MDKQDFKVKIKNTEFSALDPQTKQLVLDLKRHFSGIVYALARWSMAVQVRRKST